MASSRRTARSDRRRRAWARQYASITTADAPVKVNILSEYEGDSGALVPDGTTIGFVHLQLGLLRSTGIAEPNPSAIVGVRIASRLEDADDGSPGDVTSGGIHLDWMFWHRMFLAQNGVPTAAWCRSMEIKIGSQRRLPTQQHTLALYVEQPFGQTDDYTLSYASSALLILP